MGKTNHNPTKDAASSDAGYTIWNFDEEFPDDSTCLGWLIAHLYPDGISCPTCKRVTKHHRVRSRTCYACQFCGHQEYPMKGTIFEGSSTSLRLWFHAMYLMASTRCGISAKQLEREIGVSYPTAWRMLKQIRSMLDQDDLMLGGEVEMGESFFGGRDKSKHEVKRPHIGTGNVSKDDGRRHDATFRGKDLPQAFPLHQPRRHRSSRDVRRFPFADREGCSGRFLVAFANTSMTSSRAGTGISYPVSVR